MPDKPYHQLEHWNLEFMVSKHMAFMGALSNHMGAMSHLGVP